MAKNGLINVTANNTFQVWLDRTNELVDLMGSDVITASVSGDTTGVLGTPRNATLIGTFSANTFIANTRLRADKIGTITGSTDITLEAPTIVNTATRVAFQAFSSSVDPVVRVNNDSLAWDVGFDEDSQSFIINTGSASKRFKLTTTGNLTVSGSITAGTGGFEGSVTGNVTGDVTGTVSDISNHDTSDLDEDPSATTTSGTMYFTEGRARAAISVSGALSYDSGTGVISTTNSGIRELFSGGTGVTYDNTTGSISIGQDVATTSNVSFANLSTSGTITSVGAISSEGDVTAFASSSDVRKKENIVKIDNALEKVLGVSGYTYNFVGDDRRITGVIAQEFEKILPEVVYEIDDEELGRSKAVRYGNIVGLLIEAIKDLKAEIDELKNAN